MAARTGRVAAQAIGWRLLAGNALAGSPGQVAPAHDAVVVEIGAVAIAAARRRRIGDARTETVASAVCAGDIVVGPRCDIA